MSTNSVLVIGSIAIDWLEMPDGKSAEVLGGSATYFTLAASLFAPVHVVGVVGSDYPEEGMELFRARAANLDDLKVSHGKTFRWGGRYHKDWQRRTTLFTELGVFASFKPRLSAENRRCPNVFLGNIQPALQLHVLNQIENGEQRIICDTMNLWIETAKHDLLQVLRLIDILLLNSNEASLLTGLSDPLGAGRQICDLGPGTAVVKQGAGGVTLVKQREAMHVDAFPVPKVVDPTGAGDSFAGGFVGALAAGESLLEALIAGSATASFCVQGFGIQGLETVSLREIIHRMDVIRGRSNLP